MLRDLLNLVLRPLDLGVRSNVGLVLKGSIDRVRQAAHRFKFMPIYGIEIIGYERPLNASCEFLVTLHDVRFARLFVRYLTNVDSLHSLKKLRDVQVTYVDKGQVIKLDFGALPGLERVTLEWFHGAESIFNSTKLRSLSLMYYPSLSSEPFGRFVNLTYLRLTACGLTEVEALKRSHSLRWLALLKLNKLENFAGLSGHAAIKFLWIEGCSSLRTLEWVADMDSLETLRILDCGKVTGIDVIRSLPRLRHLHIHGSTEIAMRDPTFLRDMPNLESVVVKGLPASEIQYWRSHSKKYDLLRADLAE